MPLPKETRTKTGELWKETGREKQVREEERWQQVGGLLVQAADMVVGRASTTSEIPLLDPLRDEEKKERDELVASWDEVRRERGDQRGHELKRAHNKKVKCYRAQRRRRRTQLVNEAVSRLEASLKCSDWGPFYRGLAELGCWMTGSTADGKQYFTPEQARQHMLKIGGEENEVDVERAVASMERGPTRHELDEPIIDQECDAEVTKMKDNAAGEEVYSIVKKMFLGETPWDPVTARAVVVLLWKKKGSRTDLDKYRGISLLSICSRILARVLAKRLARAAEKYGWLSTIQCGFRSGRSVVDAAMIFRILVEEQPRESPHDESITFLLMDIKKAYPNVPWSLCWTVLKKLGLPPRVMNTIQCLNRKTLCLVRTRMGDSSTYRFRRGLREGCPSSCVVFNLFHNLALLKLQQNLSEYAIRVNGNIARPLPRKGVEFREARGDDLREVMLSVLGFADDTNVLCRKRDASTVEEITIRTLLEVGEEAHPDGEDGCGSA